jgi:hypothetical protein
LGVHHHLIFPIDAVAVRPATRRRSGGTSSSLIRTGMCCAKRTQLKVGLMEANGSLLVLRSAGNRRQLRAHERHLPLVGCGEARQ